MVHLSKHPKKPLGNNGAGNVSQQFIKDLEPLIKKYGLENTDGYKECIDWVKSNDTRGYHSLVLGLWIKENLDSKEESSLYSAVKKAVDNGVEEAQFCYGSLLLFEIGEKQDIEKGFDIMNKAFLKLFSKAFVKHSLGSEMSEGLYATYITDQVDLCHASQATTKEDLVNEYLKLCNHYNTVSLASQNAISFKAIKF